jgi:sigma-54-dependent transcriptional regulator
VTFARDALRFAPRRYVPVERGSLNRGQQQRKERGMSITMGDPLTVIEELIKVTTELSTERDLRNLLCKILSSARKLTGSEAGRIYLLDATKRHLVPEVAQNDAVEVSLDALPPIALYRKDTLNKSDLCAYAAFTGTPINIGNVYHYSGFDCKDIYAYDRVAGYRSMSVLTVPMQDHQDITIGVLQLVNPRHQGSAAPQAFDADAERLVLAFAAQAAVAVDNAWLITDKQRLIEVLDDDRRALEQENLELKQRICQGRRFVEIIGESVAMRDLYGLMEKVLNTGTTVLLLGETGTGKELIARAIHDHSERAKHPFIAQNCAALPENLLESELFGYRRGAFTGATADRKGLIEAAHGGTLFLDEIGDMPIGLQVKILRVLQAGEVRPLGEVKSRAVDVRVIAATHQDLQGLIKAGQFREDLYYRLSVFPIVVPPLRQRENDLLLLLDDFLEEFSKLHRKSIKGYSPDALRALLSYEFPGNVRELKNLVERAVIIAEENTYLSAEHFSQIGTEAQSVTDEATGEAMRLPDLVRRYEASIIQRQLEAEGWNQTQAAKALGIPRRTLVEKINRYHLLRRPESQGS